MGISEIAAALASGEDLVESGRAAIYYPGKRLLEIVEVKSPSLSVSAKYRPARNGKWLASYYVDRELEVAWTLIYGVARCTVEEELGMALRISYLGASGTARTEIVTCARGCEGAGGKWLAGLDELFRAPRNALDVGEELSVAYFAPQLGKALVLVPYDWGEVDVEVLEGIERLKVAAGSSGTLELALERGSGGTLKASLVRARPLAPMPYLISVRGWVLERELGVDAFYVERDEQRFNEALSRARAYYLGASDDDGKAQR